MSRIALLLFSFLAISPFLLGQSNDSVDYYNPKKLLYEDAVYQQGIKTVQFHLHNIELSNPIIPLRGNQQLALSFDEWGDEAYNYSYRVIHCTANWTPSDIDPFDYIDGFTENDLFDYEYAFNTLQPYTHYSLLLPNADMRFTKSGNYLLKIYDSNDEDQLILTRRFMVYENVLPVDAQIYASNISRFQATHQRIDLSIQTDGLNVFNPLADITVTVLQNGRWDNALTNIQPVFIRDNTLVYNRSDRLLFPGGNEFRFLNIQSFSLYGETVKKIVKENGRQHVYLSPDKARKKRARFTLNYHLDNNGKFTIDVKEGTFSNLDADYAQVHFILPMEKPVSEGNIYVFGGLSDWRLLPDFQMKYQHSKGYYEAVVPLKQGFYNYQYVYVKDGQKALQTDFLEGNYYTTENEYQILVYHRDFGSRYDRLVAVKTLNSFQ